jgi:hypothetical protein
MARLFSNSITFLSHGDTEITEKAFPENSVRTLWPLSFKNTLGPPKKRSGFHPRVTADTGTKAA